MVIPKIAHLIDEFIRVSNEQTTGEGLKPEAGEFVRNNRTEFENLIYEFVRIFNNNFVKEPELEYTSTSKQYWVIAAGPKGSLWDDFLENNLCAIGWDDLGDLAKFADREQIRQELISTYGGDS